VGKLIYADYALNALGIFNDRDHGDTHFLNGIETAREIIGNAPAIDAVPVVRCKDCKQWDEEQGRMGRGWCGVRMCMTRPEWFCWDGEREETAEEEQEGMDADTP